MADKIEAVCDDDADEEVSDEEVSDDDEYEEADPESKLKTGIDYNDLINARDITFELADAPTQGQESDVSNNCFSQEEIMKYLSPCQVDDDNSEDDIEFDNKTPYDILAEKMKKITEDQGVMKKIVREGQGNVVPEGANITAHYNAYLEHIDEPFDSSRLRSQPFKKSLGTYSILPGLEICLQSMKKHEIAQFLVRPKYAYGSMGCPPRIPENATILYEVELLDFLDYGPATLYNSLTEEEQHEAKFDQIMSVSKAEHKAGNHYCSNSQYGKAVGRYAKAIGLLEKCNLKDEAEEKVLKNLLLTLHLNMALCRLKLKQPVKTMMACRSALEIDCHSVKAHYRRGMAKVMVSDYAEARMCFNKARKCEPGNTEVMDALKDLDEKVLKARQMEKLMYVRMFQTHSSNATKPKPNTGIKPTSLVTNEFQTVLEERLQDFCNQNDVVEMPFLSSLTDPELSCLSDIAKRLNLKVKTVDVAGRMEIKILKNLAI